MILFLLLHFSHIKKMEIVTQKPDNNINRAYSRWTLDQIPIFKIELFLDPPNPHHFSLRDSLLSCWEEWSEPDSATSLPSICPSEGEDSLAVLREHIRNRKLHREVLSRWDCQSSASDAFGDVSHGDAHVSHGGSQVSCHVDDSFSWWNEIVTAWYQHILWSISINNQPHHITSLSIHIFEVLNGIKSKPTWDVTIRHSNCLENFTLHFLLSKSADAYYCSAPELLRQDSGL